MAEIIQKTEKKTIYREGKTLVKLFNDEYPKSDVLNEALNTARVEEGTSLNIPAVHEVTKVNGEWAIIHRCRRCGHLSSNRVAADDNPMILMSIAMRPLSRPPFPLEKLEELAELTGVGQRSDW